MHRRPIAQDIAGIRVPCAARVIEVRPHLQRDGRARGSRGRLIPRAAHLRATYIARRAARVGRVEGRPAEARQAAWKAREPAEGDGDGLAREEVPLVRVCARTIGRRRRPRGHKPLHELGCARRRRGVAINVPERDDGGGELGGGVAGRLGRAGATRLLGVGGVEWRQEPLREANVVGARQRGGRRGHGDERGERGRPLDETGHRALAARVVVEGWGAPRLAW